MSWAHPETSSRKTLWTIDSGLSKFTRSCAHPQASWGQKRAERASGVTTVLGLLRGGGGRPPTRKRTGAARRAAGPRRFDSGTAGGSEWKLRTGSLRTRNSVHRAGGARGGVRRRPASFSFPALASSARRPSSPLLSVRASVFGRVPIEPSHLSVAKEGQLCRRVVVRRTRPGRPCRGAVHSAATVSTNESSHPGCGRPISMRALPLCTTMAIAHDENRRRRSARRRTRQAGPPPSMPAGAAAAAAAVASPPTVPASANGADGAAVGAITAAA